MSAFELTAAPAHVWTLIADWRRKRDTEILAVCWLCETEPAGTGPTELCADCVNELSRC
jgi:hypothetical protein